MTETTETKVLGVITHPNPHPSDEILAMWLLYRFGERKFPGIAKILEGKKVRFARVEDLEETPEKLEADGWILLGIGGRRFDEHSSKNGARKEGETCATLVARYLGIHELPELQQVLEFSRKSDLDGQGHPLDINKSAKLAQRKGRDPWIAIGMMFYNLDLKLEEQRDFHSVGPDFERAAKTTVKSGGRELKVVIGETENEDFSFYCRSEFGGYQDIIVQRNPKTGNTQIFSRKPSSRERREGYTLIDMTDLARVIRMIEQQLCGVSVSTDRQTLEAENGPLGAENWHFPKGGMLLNGSRTATTVPPTKLSLVQIGKVVEFAIGDLFPADRVSQCSSGNCTRKTNPCPIDQFSLTRCRRVRGES